MTHNEPSAELGKGTFMTMSHLILYGLIVVVGLCSCLSTRSKSGDRTCFQVYAPYSPEIDAGSDMAIVYGVDTTFAERAAQWCEKGYAVGMMTGIAWGGYDAYYVSSGVFKKEEVQTTKDGTLLMHGRSTTVGYNVPTEPYIEYLKKYIEPAVDFGVKAVFLEEPEYWAAAGWSEAFQKAWLKFYDEPWQPPDASVDAQYRASKLKYELYYRALKEVFAHTKARASARGRDIECYVPTHSLINYAHWGIVSPESHLSDMPELDGYVAQVWTGTARTPNILCGIAKERTFETAYLEYGQMFSMVRPTGRTVWFLADPVEDNPDRSWADYKKNYECTLVASLMWPEVRHFEVMPWPDRIFKGTYPKVDLDTRSGDRESIPADYASELLVVFNALNDMDQKDVHYDTGTRGIGVLVSDSMMFQRAAPHPSDRALGDFYGLALPLVKAGIPVDVVQLENVVYAGCLTPYKVLLLTYEYQKPLRPAYHDALVRWVRRGGALLYVGDGSDPYHHVREWWNDNGRTATRPDEELFTRLGVVPGKDAVPQRVGRGWVYVAQEKPSQLQHEKSGAEKVQRWVAELLACLDEPMLTKNYLMVRRGPYVVAAVLDESVSDGPLRVTGAFVDLFDASLPIVRERIVAPNERAFLYDLDWARRNGQVAKVAAASARIRNENVRGRRLSFTARGPKSTTAVARILLPGMPTSISMNPAVDFTHEWDPVSSTVRLSFSNQAEDLSLVLTW